jgi:hypothetical protein
LTFNKAPRLERGGDYPFAPGAMGHIGPAGQRYSTLVRNRGTRRRRAFCDAIHADDARPFASEEDCSRLAIAGAWPR